MKFEAGEQENDNGLLSSVGDSIGDGVRLDQPTLAAMIASQPISSGELMESVKFKEFGDTQHGKKENCGSFVLPNCGAEFVSNGEGLEEPRSGVNSEVRSQENSEETEEKYGELKRGDEEDTMCANRGVLYNPIQTAPSQNGFQSPQRSGRPTRSTVRPCRFRDDACETQFQPGRRKKIRKVCFHPGRGDFRGFSSVDGVCETIWPHCRSRLAARRMVKSDGVNDCTRRLQAAVDEINLGNSMSKPRNTEILSPSDGCEEGELKANGDICDRVLCVHEENTDDQVSIRQLLDTGQSSVGAQQLQEVQPLFSPGCIVNSSLPQSSVLTARAVDRGVIFTPMPPTERVNNCFAVCDEVIKRRDHHQTTVRCASCAEQCSSVQRLQLYPCRQRIRSQLSSIIEQSEGDDSTAIPSFKVSQPKTLNLTPLSSSEIFSSCSAESGNVADMSADTSDYSALPCILVQDQKAEQRRIVSDVPADVPRAKPLGNVATISARNKLELDEHNNWDDRGDIVFPETSRMSEVKESKTVCDRMFIGASTSKSSIIHEWKGVSRPLCGRLQKHKKRYSHFSNQQKKWTLPRRKCPEIMPHVEYRGALVGHESENKAVPHVECRDAPVGHDNGKKAKTPLFCQDNESKEEKKTHSRTCMEAMNCIARMSRQMQFEIAKMFSMWSYERGDDEWRCRKSGSQSGCTCNNVQLSDVSTINSMDVCVDAATAEEMPACRVSSERSARCGRMPLTSAPAQLMARALRKTAFDVSLLEKRDMYASNSYSKYTVPESEYSSRNCYSQNAIPCVRMARTKQTARRDRDDRRRDEDRRGDDRRSEERRGREPTKSTARRRRRGTPPPENISASSVRRRISKELTTRGT